MSEPEYMTGEELHAMLLESLPSVLSIEYHKRSYTTHRELDALAAVLKVPRPPKPKTLLQVFDEWDENRQLTCLEGTVESLRVQLNAAREALNKAVT